MKQRSYRELAAELERAGFEREWGRGSHCKWTLGRTTVGMKFNHPGHTATPGVTRAVSRVIEEVGK